MTLAFRLLAHFPIRTIAFLDKKLIVSPPWVTIVYDQSEGLGEVCGLLACRPGFCAPTEKKSTRSFVHFLGLAAPPVEAPHNSILYLSQTTTKTLIFNAAILLWLKFKSSILAALWLHIVTTLSDCSRKSYFLLLVSEKWLAKIFSFKVLKRRMPLNLNDEEIYWGICQVCCCLELSQVLNVKTMKLVSRRRQVLWLERKNHK